MCCSPSSELAIIYLGPCKKRDKQNPKLKAKRFVLHRLDIDPRLETK